VDADRRKWTELELIRAIVLEGDDAALKEFVSRLHRCTNTVLNQRGWFREATVATREEIVDESLTRLIEVYKRGFDGVNEQFRKYIYKVVFAVTYEEVKRLRRESLLDQEVTRPDGSTAPLRDLVRLDITPWPGQVIDPTDPVEGIARSERAKRLASALAVLKPEDREMLCLFEVENLSTREIARRMGLSEGNVSVRLHRAKDKVCRAYLKTFAETPSKRDEKWIPFLIERLPADEAAVLRIWWQVGGAIANIAEQLGILEGHCKAMFDRGKAHLVRLAEETPHAY
jgi:RNA polymerase sigma factor (sigma-70 family)